MSEASPIFSEEPESHTLQGDAVMGRVILLFGKNAPRYLNPASQESPPQTALISGDNDISDEASFLSRVRHDSLSNLESSTRPEPGIQAKPEEVEESNTFKEFRNTMYFNFHEGRMRGTGVLSATDTSRFRAVIQAITEQANEYAEITVPAAENIAGTLDKQGTLDKFFNSVVTINGVTYKKRDILSQDQVLDILTPELVSLNDPALQALLQVESQYPELSKGALHTLRKKVLGTFHEERIKALYYEREAEVKKFSKFLSGLIRLY